MSLYVYDIQKVLFAYIFFFSRSPKSTIDQPPGKRRTSTIFSYTFCLLDAQQQREDDGCQ